MAIDPVTSATCCHPCDWFSFLQVSKTLDNSVNQVPNRLFPNWPTPLFQSEAKCEAIDLKIFFFFYSHKNKTHFHKKGLALLESLIWF